MTAFLNLFAISLSILFFSIPIWNKYVFHTINIDAIIMDGREALARVNELRSNGKVPESRDSAEALIERYRNDSAEIFLQDIIDWKAALKLLDSNNTTFASQLYTKRLNENDLGLFRSYTIDDLNKIIKKQMVGLFNAVKSDSSLYVKNTSQININSDGFVSGLYKKLVEKGVIVESGNVPTLKPNMTSQERHMLQKFHVAILDRLLYPGILKKDYRRGSDWASEYIVQTAMYFIGVGYRAQFEFD